MKNTTLKIMVIMLIITMGAMLTCKSASQLSFRKVSADFTTGKIKQFVKKSNGKEGAYLFKENKRTMFLLLNEDYNKIDGQSAVYPTKIKVTPIGNSLKISYYVDSKASMKNKRYMNRLLYRIRLHRNFTNIILYKNGKEIKPVESL